MKKKILEALKTKFTGVKDEVLERIADNLAKTVTDEAGIQTAVDGVTFQQVLDSYGDARANQAQATAVKNYESKYNLKDGKPAAEPAGGTGGGTPTGTPTGTTNGGEQGAGAASTANLSPEMKLMMEQFKVMQQNQKTLTDKLTALETEKTANSRKGRFNELLKGAPEKIRTRYEKDFARLSFKDDDDFNSWLDDIKPDIEALSNEHQAAGAAGHAPRGGGKGNPGGQADPLVAARAAQHAAQAQATAVPVIQGLPAQPGAAAPAPGTPAPGATA